MTQGPAAGIALSPRSIGLCLDMALYVIGRRLGDGLALFASVAVPVGLFVGLGAGWTDYGWVFAVAGGLFGSVPLGLLIVTYAMSLALGDGLSWTETWRRMLGTMRGLLAVKLLGRGLIGVCAPLLIPSVWMLVTYGFEAERRAFRHYREDRHQHQVRDLVRGAYSDLLIRAATLFAFGGLLWLVLLLTTDATCKLLVDYSPLFAPLAAASEDPWGYLDPFEVMGNVLTAAVTHPAILTVVTLTGLATYAVLRLAWFFTYVDLRIREDLWDLEAALATEAARWGGALE